MIDDDSTHMREKNTRQMQVSRRQWLRPRPEARDTPTLMVNGRFGKAAVQTAQSRWVREGRGRLKNRKIHTSSPPCTQDCLCHLQSLLQSETEEARPLAWKLLRISRWWDFPGGPGAKNPRFHGRVCRFGPWLGNQDPSCLVVWHTHEKEFQEGKSPGSRPCMWPCGKL